jgi:hypothetical protein
VEVRHEGSPRWLLTAVQRLERHNGTESSEILLNEPFVSSITWADQPPTGELGGIEQTVQSYFRLPPLGEPVASADVLDSLVTDYDGLLLKYAGVDVVDIAFDIHCSGSVTYSGTVHTLHISESSVVTCDPEFSEADMPPQMIDVRHTFCPLA